MKTIIYFKFILICLIYKRKMKRNYIFLSSKTASLQSQCKYKLYLQPKEFSFQINYAQMLWEIASFLECKQYQQSNHKEADPFLTFERIIIKKSICSVSVEIKQRTKSWTFTFIFLNECIYLFIYSFTMLLQLTINIASNKSIGWIKKGSGISITYKGA